MHVNEFLVMFVKVTIEYLGNCCLVVRSPFIISYESTLTKELLCELNDDDFAIFNLHLHPNSLCQRKGKSSFRSLEMVIASCCNKLSKEYFS